MSMTYIMIGALLLVGIILYVFGLQKGSQMVRFFGATGFLTAIFLYIGWVAILPLVAVFALGISYIGKKDTASV